MDLNIPTRLAPPRWLSLRPTAWLGNLQQAWFPGFHCNVGGSSDPDGVANEALHWIVEKAEALGLEFDGDYLSHYLPCFNSELHDSMSTMYRLMKRHVRAIGRQGLDGEVIHQSALDRMNLQECGYEPQNLSHALARGATGTVDTQRVERGQPCPSLPGRV